MHFTYGGVNHGFKESSNKESSFKEKGRSPEEEGCVQEGSFKESSFKEEGRSPEEEGCIQEESSPQEKGCSQEESRASSNVKRGFTVKTKGPLRAFCFCVSL